MSDFTLVNKQAMSGGIDALRRAHSDLTSHLDSLEGQLGSSLANWEGDARSAYTQAKAEWDKAAQKMASVVMKMSSTLQTIDTSYSANEANIAGRWGGR